MRIAITGGTGFVGSHLARSLLARGHDVVSVAREVRNTDDALLTTARPRRVETDLSDVETLADAFAGCSAVAHCAGINRETGRPPVWNRVPVHRGPDPNRVAGTRTLHARGFAMVRRDPSTNPRPA